MTTLVKSGAQWPLTILFDFNIGATGGADAMKNSASPSVLTAFNAATGTTYNIATLPPNSIVVGGEIEVLTVSNDTGTSTISLGDAASATRYASAVNFKAAARTALTLTAFLNSSSTDLLLTLANQNGNATTGRAIITAQIVISGRVNENLKMV